MDGWLILWGALALLVYMSIAFGVAYQRKRLDTVDAAWGGGFVVVAWLVAGLNLHVRTLLMAVLIDIWAIRLTAHIMERSRRRSQDDPRYEQIAAKWNPKTYWFRAYTSVFLLQGLLVLLISAPVLFISDRPLSHATAIMIAGVAVWLVGFIVETISDRQLRLFVSDPHNKGNVLETGLWKYSRHPNYLGEITEWYGLGVIACSVSFGWIGLAGPLILNLLIRFVSGVPPIENRKKQDKAYAAYMSRTNPLLPKLRRAR